MTEEASTEEQDIVLYEDDAHTLDTGAKVCCQAFHHGFGPASIIGIQPVQQRPVSRPSGQQPAIRHLLR